MKMWSPLRTPFGAVFQNEVLLNSRRVAPYSLLVFFGSNAALWSIAGAAVHYGWATNSDFFIARNFGGFAFGILGLPLFAALIMADPVIRDFHLGIDPLIFSKPISRAQYLLGKFFGSFFVLVCCQAGFALTMMLLQVFHTARMVVLPFRVFPYFKHFFMLVVVSYLLFAAVYFTVGTLTRNAKIVYGLGVAYYPLYIAWQLLVLKNLPPGWRTMLDPFLMSSEKQQPWGQSPDWVDRIDVSYSSEMIANRALVILAAAACLVILYLRFSIAGRNKGVESFSTLKLSAGGQTYSYSPSVAAIGAEVPGLPIIAGQEESANIELPSVATASGGVCANLRKLSAALSVEFRLLRVERSLVVIMPLAVFLSILEVAFFKVVPTVSYSAAYATNTAQALSLFLLGLTVFYTGEAMHRDREVRIEPLLWATPVANSVLLLSKFLAMILLMLSLIVLVGFAAIVVQALRGNTAIEISPYLITYSVILVPSLVLVAGLSLTLNVILRDKYLTYAVSIGTSALLLYLYSQGHNHWLYNPLLYHLWKEIDVASVGHHLLLQRLYWMSVAGACLTLAHLCHARRSERRLTFGVRRQRRRFGL